MKTVLLEGADLRGSLCVGYVNFNVRF